MKPEEAKKLTEKFFAGETSLDEEKRLKEYFGREHVPDELRTAKEYFDFLRDEKDVSLGESFDEKLLETADSVTDKPQRRSGKVWVYRLVGLAASVLLLAWLGVKIFKPVQVQGTITDPVVAFNQTRAALNLAASGINKSLKPAEKAVKTIDESLQKVYELRKWNRNLEKTEETIYIGRNAIKDNS